MTEMNESWNKATAKAATLEVDQLNYIAGPTVDLLQADASDTRISRSDSFTWACRWKSAASKKPSSCPAVP